MKNVQNAQSGSTLDSAQDQIAKQAYPETLKNGSYLM